MKRGLLLVLCLALLCPTALAENYLASYYTQEQGDYYCLLLREDGKLLTPTDAYQSIYQITPEDTPEDEALYAAVPSDLGIEYDPATAEEILYDMSYARMGLMDARGNMLTDFDYTGLSCINGYVLFTLPGDEQLTGAMDMRGNVVMSAEYAALQPLPGGRWLAMPQEGAERISEFDDGEEIYYQYRYALQLIDSDGSVRDLGLHSTDRYFSANAEGICAIWSLQEYDDRMVFVGSDGQVMFDRGFEGGDNFVGDYAPVRVEEGFGIIDKTGDFVVAPEFEYINLVDGRVYVASGVSRVAAFSEADCRTILDMDFAPSESVDISAFGDELFLIQVDGEKLLYGPFGEELATFPEDCYIQTYNQPPRSIGRLIRAEGEWPDERVCLIDLEGNAVSDDHREIILGAWQGDEARYVTVDYDTYTDAQGEARVNWKGYRYGLIDQDGKVLLPAKYDELQALSFDRYWAVKGNLRGMIDSTGKWYFSISDYEELMD